MSADRDKPPATAKKDQAQLAPAPAANIRPLARPFKNGPGNQAVLRAMRSGKNRVNTVLSQPGDADERAADQTASKFIAGEDTRLRNHSRQRPQPGRGMLRGGILPKDIRRDYEDFFAVDLSRVRIHTGSEAEQAASKIGARAFTDSQDIYFHRDQFDPASQQGRKLLAHELTHAIKNLGQAAGGKLYRQPFGEFRDPNSEIVSDVPGALPTDLMDPTSGVDVDETISIAAPVLALQRRTREDAAQTYHLHSAIISQIPISAYAIPRSRLTLDVDGLQPAASDAGGAQPDVATGTHVYGPDHLPLAVLGSDATNVIVESSVTTHYAVGAGSCILVRTTSGWYLFDAGINLTEPHALADAVVAKIAARVGSEPIRAVFLTHAHYDHTSLLTRLARRIQIDVIVANPRQLMREEYIRIRDAMRPADLERRAAERTRIEADTAAREAFVEELRRSGRWEAVNAQDVHRLWSEEVGRQVDAMYPVMREMAALPVRGSAGIEFETIGTNPLHGGETGPRANLEEILPSREGGTELRGVVDPDLRARQHEPLAEHEVDRMSTTYILTVDGRRLAVLPDLRRTDIHRIELELREVLGTRNVEFQEWVLGHHTQVGFMEGMVSARTLRQTLQLLHDFRARGAQGRAGRDAVIASVDPAQVDPAQIRLLRLLGFETYLAQSQADVHSYEVLSGGRLIRGVRAPLAPGARGEATLRRAILGRREIEAQRDALRSQRRETRGPGSRARKAELQQQIEALEVRINNLNTLEDRLVDTVRAHPNDVDAIQRAEADLNAALDAERVGRVVTSSSQLTDTALVLLREPLGPEPPPGSPEAEQRARDLALREQKSRVDTLRMRISDVPPAERQAAYAELYVELVQYEHQLAAAREAHGPGVTQEFAGVELERIAADRAELERSFRSRTEAVRLPDGQLVENKLVRVSSPERAEARAPSRTTRVILQGLDVAGRTMGAVMLISTIRGSVDLIDRYEQDQANLGQLGIGGAREVTSGIVGWRMLRGARVHPGVFVAISLLEVGEAAAGDYDSESQRRRAMDTAVRNAAINTGCLIVGEMLMSTMNPIGLLAGAVVMFLGPAIINLLFGDDTPEQLYPEEVGEVDEVLVELLAEYRAVVGGLSVQRRDAAARSAIGLTEDISHEAEISILNHRMRALYLESQILPAFEAAYARVREGRAGLREIDEMRRQFLAMRAEASTDETDEDARRQINIMYQGMTDPNIIPVNFHLEEQYDASGNLIPIREQTLRRFEAMESSLSLRYLSAEQVHDMEQWSSIRDTAVDLLMQLLREQAVDPDWADIAQRQHDLEARLASARYRLNPQAQYDQPEHAPRQTGLLGVGTEARRAYEEELARAENWLRTVEYFVIRSHWVNFRLEHVETPNIEALWRNAQQFETPVIRNLAVLDDALDVYQRTIEAIGGPPERVGGVEALYREPSARAIYLSEIERNRSFRKLLQRLQVNEVAARSLMRSMDAEVSAAEESGSTQESSSSRVRLEALQERFLTLQNDRKVRRGILYSYEVEALGAREQQRAISFYGPLLGGRPEDPALTAEEITAFQTGDYGDVGTRLLGERRTIVERLAQIPGLRVPTGPTEVTDASGTTMRVVRELHGIMRLDALTSDETLLVGIVAQDSIMGLVRVIPLNDAAVTALGGYAPTFVDESRLIAASEDDLSR